jgi:DNA-binding MarR family transcriptional regulator
LSDPKQGNFSSEVLRYLAAVRELEAATQAVKNRHGDNPPGYAIICTLAEKGSCTFNELVAATDLSRSEIAMACNQLAEQKPPLIEVISSGPPRRQLSAAGRKFHAQLMARPSFSVFREQEQADLFEASS